MKSSFISSTTNEFPIYTQRVTEKAIFYRECFF
uniref:Uncharacterized protein n=1 Tax=Anguilla anguilla TaxID=7936 RepID=A0A0E9VAR2_ANGAN